MTATAPRIEGEFALIQTPSRVVLGESAEGLRATIEDAFRQGVRYLVVDIAGCAYMDSSGIGELLAGMRQAREAGGAVAIVGPRGKIHEILEVTKLASLFVLAPDEAAARALLLSRP